MKSKSPIPSGTFVTATTTTAKCHFLDSLPTELRLQIYSYLLTSSSPLQGRAARARNERGCSSLGLDLAILRVNRQVWEEARTVFLGENEIAVNSLDEEQREGMGRTKGNFDPPLKMSDFRLVRRLRVNLLYAPQLDMGDESEEALDCIPNITANSEEAGKANGKRKGAWDDNESGAAEYVNSLTSILSTTTTALKSLTLTATTPPGRTLSTQSCLSSFYNLDRHRFFTDALPALAARRQYPSAKPGLTSIPLLFEFDDCFYGTDVVGRGAGAESILVLACCVLFCRSRVRIRKMIGEYEGDGAPEEEEGNDGDQYQQDEDEEDGDVRRGRRCSVGSVRLCASEVAGKVDLGPLVRAWPADLMGVCDVVGKARREVDGVEGIEE